jgi:two-component sensor histidine kinase
MKVCKFLLFICLLFLMQKGYSQSVYNTQQEADGQLKVVQSSANNKDKADTLIKLSQWYYDHNATDTTFINKAFSLATNARHLATTLQYTKGLFDIHLLLSKINIITGNFKAATSDAENALRYAVALKDETGKGDAYMALWDCNAANDISYDDQLPILQKAETAFQNSGNKKREGDCNYKAAETYLYLDAYANAERKLRSALRLYKQVNYLQLTPVYDLLGVLYCHLDNLDLAVQYGLLAAKTAENQSDTSLETGFFYFNLGLTYKAIHDLPMAKKYLEKALEIEEKYNHLDGIFTVTIYLGWVMGSQRKQREVLKLYNDMTKKHPSIEKINIIQYAGAMIEAYNGLGEYKNAMPFCNILEEKKKHSTNDFGTMDIIYNKLIYFYAATGETKKAKQYNKEYFDHIKILNTPSAWLEYYLMSSFVDSAAGNYFGALKNSKIAKKFNDSIMEARKMRQISELNIMYGTAQKDKDLTILKKESELKSLNIKQSDLMRNISIIAAASLMAIAIIIYIGYRRKQRTNMLLKQQQDEIANNNETLKTLVKEKEWLVKEIHHRVKNNLHMVIGLLASQSEFLENKEALSAITDSQNRIQAMSLIHQKLYQMGDMSTTNMPAYIKELTEQLKDSFKESKHVLFKLDIANVDFSLSYSVPIGLILNEAITNAMKYAFPDKKGIVEIRLDIKDGFYHLSIKDNGIGFPEGFSIEKCTSLGIVLMNGLSGDIGGTFHVESMDNGLLIETIFPIEEYNPLNS